MNDFPESPQIIVGGKRYCVALNLNAKIRDETTCAPGPPRSEIPFDRPRFLGRFFCPDEFVVEEVFSCREIFLPESLKADLGFWGYAQISVKEVSFEVDYEEELSDAPPLEGAYQDNDLPRPVKIRRPIKRIEFSGDVLGIAPVSF